MKFNEFDLPRKLSKILKRISKDMFPFIGIYEVLGDFTVAKVYFIHKAEDLICEDYYSANKTSNKEVNACNSQVLNAYAKDFKIDDKYYDAMPTITKGEFVETLFMSCDSDEFSDEELALAEFGTSMACLKIPAGISSKKNLYCQMK